MYKVRRTKLAMKAGTNYTACNRYVAWLAKVNWVSVQDSEIGLTEAGIQVCTRLFVSQSIKTPFFIIQIFCLASAYCALLTGC
jgi:predicted transcriptional regulator